MQDRQLELIYHPRELLSLQGVERVLCVAPHPDDEVLGCGGLLTAWAEAGARVHTVILTCGQQGAGPTEAGFDAELPARRRQESIAAAAVLGTAEPLFLEFEDRALRCDHALVAALSQAIAQHRPQVLLLPSLSEPHPDHQATALAGLAAASQAGPSLHTVLSYECGAPLHANAHFPIDAVAERKWRALQCFTSQLGVEDYEPHARAMAALRAFGLRPPCQQAESFFRVDLAAVREKGALAALPQWPWVRERLHLANDPAQLPLVSVLVRSMNRACLPEALASVALQTHANLELVVVNASGGPHRPLDFLPPTLPWRLVSPAPTAHTTDGPCGRAQAANLALAAAQGEYALFLDDDDLLEPLHLERLIAALQAHPQAVGAYAGVRVETQDGAHLRDYDLPWSRQRLQGVNFLPIHAVLFRMDNVRQRGLRFDEQLPVLEDWEFWLQLTEGADLVHCPGVSAVYRQGLGQSALGDAQHPHHWRLWHRRLLQQRVQALAPEALTETLAWHAVELDRTQAEAARQDAMHMGALAGLEQVRAQTAQQVQVQVQALELALFNAQSFAQQSDTARQALQQRLEAFGRESQTALAAKEAALQLQAAESARQLAEREAQSQGFAAQAQAALAAKELELQALAAESARQLAEREAQSQGFAAQAQAALAAKELELQALAAESARQLAEREAQSQGFAAQAQAALAAKELELQALAAESARQLAEREAQAQGFAADSQRELDALQVRLHTLAGEQALLLQAKEFELQRFGLEVRQTLDAKEAQLQRVASEAQQALQVKDRELEALQQRLLREQQAHADLLQHQAQDHAAAQHRLQQEVAALQAELANRSQELMAVYATRAWRWTAPLRRSTVRSVGAKP
jgi:LmbE family N-acetylglucosaminyl deacetylase